MIHENLSHICTSCTSSKLELNHYLQLVYSKVTKLFLFINVDYQITDVQLLCTFCPFFCWRKNRDWRTSNSKKSASVRITSEEIQEGNQDRSGIVQGQP